MLVAALMLYVSRSFPKASTGASDLTGPSFYPTLLAILFVICGVSELIVGFKNNEDSRHLSTDGISKTFKQAGFYNALLVILLIVGFILLMEIIGFIVCTYLIVLILLKRFEVSWISSLIYAGVLVAVVYLIFGKLFTIYLPSGVLDYIGL